MHPPTGLLQFSRYFQPLCPRVPLNRTWVSSFSSSGPVQVPRLSPKHRETVPSCQESSSCGSTCAVGPWKEVDLTLLNMAVFLMAWTSSGASGGSRYLSLVSSQFCLYKTWRENRWTGARPVTPGGRIWRAGGTLKVWPHAKAAESYQENADHADILAHLVGIRKLSQPTN